MRHTHGASRSLRDAHRHRHQHQRCRLHRHQQNSGLLRQRLGLRRTRQQPRPPLQPAFRSASTPPRRECRQKRCQAHPHRLLLLLLSPTRPAGRPRPMVGIMVHRRRVPAGTHRQRRPPYTRRHHRRSSGRQTQELRRQHQSLPRARLQSFDRQIRDDPTTQRYSLQLRTISS